MTRKSAFSGFLTGLFCYAVLGWLWGIGVAAWVLVRNDALFGPWPTVATIAALATPPGIIFGAPLGALLGLVLSIRIEKPLRYLIAIFIAGVIGWIIYIPSVDKDLAHWISILLRIAAGLASMIIFTLLIKIFNKWNLIDRLPWKPIVIIWIALAILVEVPFLARRYSFSRVGETENKSVKAEETKTLATAPKFSPLEFFPARDKDDRGKVFILGIDAVSPDKLDSLMRQGRLPNFARLKAKSAYSEIKTMKPTFSPRIWTTVATGKKPEVNGIKDFTLYHYAFLNRWNKIHIPSQVSFLKKLIEPYTAHAVIPISNSQRKVKALWNIASESGISVGLVGWWISWPPEKINGFVVTDHSYFDEIDNNIRRGWYSRAIRGDLTYPPNLFNELKQFYTPLDSATPETVKNFVHFSDDDKAKFKDMLQNAPMKRIENPLRLIVLGIFNDNFYSGSAIALIKSRGQPEFMMAYLRSADWISHGSWPYTLPEAEEKGYDKAMISRYKDSVDATYIFIDTWLGKFLDVIEPGTTLIVMSDHGYGPDPDDDSGYGHYFPYPGVVFVTGPNVKAGAKIDKASVEDVAVNVLTWLGFPIGEDMVGKPWREIMKDEWNNRHPARTIKTYEAGYVKGVAGQSSEDKSVMERLKALGYVK